MKLLGVIMYNVPHFLPHLSHFPPQVDDMASSSSAVTSKHSGKPGFR